MSSFEVKETGDKGRSMFATANIKAGDTIYEETPFVSSQFSWNQACKYLACENCIKPLETAEANVRRLTGLETIDLPLKECCYVLKQIDKHVVCPDCGTQYCSEECRLEAFQKYHNKLCLKNSHNDENHPLNRLYEAWRKIHYPPETTTIALIVKLLGMYMQSEIKQEFINNLKDFQCKVFNEDLLIEHKMLGPNFRNQLNELYPLYCEAFKDTGAAEFLTPEAFKTFFAAIGINGQGIGTSPFADWVRNVSEKSTSGDSDEKSGLDIYIADLYKKLDIVTGLQFLNNEGSALYITQSKINHSCVPNALITFPYSNHILVIKAISDIKIGEEVYISYLDECSVERSRHSRQKELKENYLFVCHCVRCENEIDDPDVTSEEEEDYDEADDDDDEMEE